MSPPDKVIAVCPACEAKLAVPATAVGKKMRCPKCQTVVAITADMVSQTAATGSEPPNAAEVSLGVENTFTGPAKKNTAPESLGDEFTYGGNHGTDDAFVDDDMEIVDLSARYTIEGVLGKGGMGEVQLATDNRLKRKVAIKRVLGDMAKNQTAVRRFMTEAQSIAALSHPNIVQIYDYGRDKDGPFLILEYVEGKTLSLGAQNQPPKGASKPAILRIERCHAHCLRRFFPWTGGSHVESAINGTNTGNTSTCGDRKIESGDIESSGN